MLIYPNQNTKIQLKITVNKRARGLNNVLRAIILPNLVQHFQKDIELQHVQVVDGLFSELDREGKDPINYGLSLAGQLQFKSLLVPFKSGFSYPTLVFQATNDT